MTKKIRIALMAAVGVVVAVLATLLSGTFDGVLQRALGPGAEAPNSSDIAATPVPDPSVEDPSAANAEIGERIIPVFDLVRVEPSGDAVIAGQGAPNTEVEIFAGGGVIAKGKTNTSGEWAVVLEDPLAAGAHDIKVRSKAADGSELVSEQSVAVSVPEGGSGEVLVILNQPGTVAEVLQVPGSADTGSEPIDPTVPPPAAETVVAALDPATEPTAVPATEQPAAAIPAETAPTLSTPPSIADLPVPPAVPQEDANNPADAPSAEAQADGLPSEAPTSAAASDPVAPAGEPSPPAVTVTEPGEPGVPAAAIDPAQITTGPAVGGALPSIAELPAPGEEPATREPASPASAGEQGVPSVAAPGETIVIAAAPPVDAGAASQSAVVIPPTADAGKATAADATAGEAAAGEATAGEATAGEAAAGEAAAGEAAAGEAAAGEATAGEAAAGEAAAGEAAAGEATAGEAAAGEATAPATVPSADGTPAGQGVAALDPADPAAAPSQPAAPVSVEAVELENGERFFAAGAAAPGAVLRLYVDDGLTEETRAMDTGRWLVDSIVPLDPGDHTVRVDHIAPDGSVLARAEVPFEILEDLLTGPTGATVIGSAGAGSGTAGEARVGDTQTMIIRRGDNLWRIARRLYGSGVRYSTIYQANTDQIGNPDLIYPGQVFVLPQGDRNWEPGATSIE